jgi:xylulokinase
LIKQGKDPGSLYAAMIEEAQLAPAGSENLYFLPYLTGARCPHPDPNARGAYIGLTPRHHRAHLIRSTIEGITYGMREQISIFRSMNIPITQVRASGGGARSQFWRQLQSDMYEAPVVTINAAEGAALGVAILAGVGSGVWQSVPEATKFIIKVKEKSDTNKKLASLYAGKYPRYAALYPALKSQFDLLSS